MAYTDRLIITTGKIILSFLVCLLVFFSSFGNTYASENQFVTIVNPVRIASYTDNSAKSIRAEYAVIREFSLPATWLLTYDVLSNKDAVDVVKSMDSEQEAGIFLEVGPLLCENAHVTCNQGSWHHANVVFLSGYTQEDRKLLIDELFDTFHEKFGYYPTSVGSWWTDSYSLSYMKEKYGITASLGCSDQFATDGYQLWGQYWMYPYFPSRYYAGIPAASRDVQLDLVMTQWAPRDPLNGYYSSLYSTQDYHVSPVNKDIEYFKQLVEVYAKRHENSYGHVTVGLEGDFNPNTYNQHYREQMQFVSEMNKNGEIAVATMKLFSEWFRKEYDTTPITTVITDDLLGTNKKVIWFQSNKLRFGMEYGTLSKRSSLFDMRTYHSDLEEPFYLYPNRENHISINIPSYIDVFMDKDSIWNLELGELLKTERDTLALKVSFTDGEVLFTSDGIQVKGEAVEIPSVIKNSNALSVTQRGNTVGVTVNDQWIVPRDGVTISALTEEATHELKRKRTIGLGVLGGGLWVVSLVIIFHSYLKLHKKLFILFFSICLIVFLGYRWYLRNYALYFISQSEIDALYHLSVMQSGKVLVYDKECLGCSYAGEIKPAAFANKRNYVSKYGKHPIVQNQKVFDAKRQEEAKKEFAKTGAKYIYLVKYIDSIERIPFSPGDLNIEKVYSNANTEVWKVKN